MQSGKIKELDLIQKILMEFVSVFIIAILQKKVAPAIFP